MCVVGHGCGGFGGVGAWMEVVDGMHAGQSQGVGRLSEHFPNAR